MDQSAQSYSADNFLTWKPKTKTLGLTSHALYPAFFTTKPRHLTPTCPACVALPQVIFVNQQKEQPQPQQQRRQETTTSGTAGSTASRQSIESMQGQSGSGYPAPSSHNSSTNAQAGKASPSPGHQKPSVKFASSSPGGGMPDGAVPCRRAAKCTNPSCG